MGEIVTKTKLENASVDCQTLEDCVNGPADTKVISRLGRQYWTLATIDSKVANVVSQADYALILIQEAQDQIVAIADTAQEQFDVKMTDLESQANTAINEWNTAIQQITMESLPALAVTTANTQTQQAINDSVGAKWYAKGGGYPINFRVMLDNGDIVKSTVPNNTANPNTDMTGWELENKKERDFIGLSVTPEMFFQVPEVDWTGALTRAWEYIQTYNAECILDSKEYLISSPLPVITTRCSIIGKGMRNSIIKLSKNLSGTAISTYNINWAAIAPDRANQVNPNSDTVELTGCKFGVTIKDFSISGDRSTTNLQNGLMHYGITDSLDLNNVSVHNIKGVGWGVSSLPSDGASGQASMRECLLGNIYVRRCGYQADDIPAVLFRTANTDASNQVTIAKLDSIWPDGCGVRFVSDGGVEERLRAGRYIRIQSGMIHGREDTTGNPQTKPLLEIAGLWLACDFNFSEINGVRDGQYAVHIHKNALNMSRECRLGGYIGSNSNGIYIEHGRAWDIDCLQIFAASGSAIRFGAEVDQEIFFNGYAEDQYDTWNITYDAGSTAKPVFKYKGGPFIIRGTDGKRQGGLINNGTDGFRLAVQSESGNANYTGFIFGKTTATDNSIQCSPLVNQSLLFNPRTVLSDASRQVYFEQRGVLNCLVIQRTNAASRKAISWNNIMPSDGTWNSGDVVYNSVPTILGSTGSQYVVSHWLRLTNGSTHVIGTDWVGCRSPIGT